MAKLADAPDSNTGDASQAGSSPAPGATLNCWIAQPVERRLDKARVPGSSPGRATRFEVRRRLGHAQLKLTNACPGGGIGRRTSFRYWRRKARGFESLPGHQVLPLARAAAPLRRRFRGIAQTAEHWFHTSVVASSNLASASSPKPVSRAPPPGNGGSAYDDALGIRRGWRRGLSARWYPDLLVFST